MQEESVPPPPHKNSADLFFRPALFLLAMFVIIHLGYAFRDLLACSIQPLSHSTAFIPAIIMSCFTSISHEAPTTCKFRCLGKLLYPCRNKYIFHPLRINLYLHDNSSLSLVRLRTSVIQCHPRHRTPATWTTFLLPGLLTSIIVHFLSKLKHPYKHCHKKYKSKSWVGFPFPQHLGLLYTL